MSKLQNASFEKLTNLDQGTANKTDKLGGSNDCGPDYCPPDNSCAPSTCNPTLCNPECGPQGNCYPYMEDQEDDYPTPRP